MRCQFCGQILPNAAPVSTRGVVILKDASIRRDRLTWQEYGYIVCSCLLILFGILNILSGLAVIPAVSSMPGIGTFLEVVGSFQVIMGIALLMQQIWAQFLMKWILIVQLFVAARNIFLAAAAPAAFHFVSPVVVITLSLVELVYSSFLLYFIIDMADV